MTFLITTAAGAARFLGRVRATAAIVGAPARRPSRFGVYAAVLAIPAVVLVHEAEPAFVERAPGVIIVLLAFPILANPGAVLLRRRFECRRQGGDR